MSTNRLERPTSPSPQRRRRQHSLTIETRHRIAPSSHHIQRICIRRPTLEVHPPTTRSPRPARWNCIGVLYCNKQRSLGYHWRSDIQRDARASGTIFQQNSMFLLWRAEIECGRIGRYARVFLYWSGFCEGSQYAEYRYDYFVVYIFQWVYICWIFCFSELYTDGFLRGAVWR